MKISEVLPSEDLREWPLGLLWKGPNFFILVLKTPTWQPCPIFYLGEDHIGRGVAEGRQVWGAHGVAKRPKIAATEAEAGS